MQIFNEHHITKEKGQIRSSLLTAGLTTLATVITLAYNELQSLPVINKFRKRFLDQYGVNTLISFPEPLTPTLSRTQAILMFFLFLLHMRIINNIDNIYTRREFLEEIGGIVTTLLCLNETIKTPITNLAKILYGQNPDPKDIEAFMISQSTNIINTIKNYNELKAQKTIESAETITAINVKEIDLGNWYLFIIESFSINGTTYFEKIAIVVEKTTSDPDFNLTLASSLGSETIESAIPLTKHPRKIARKIPSPAISLGDLTHRPDLMHYSNQTNGEIEDAEKLPYILTDPDLLSLILLDYPPGELKKILNNKPDSNNKFPLLTGPKGLKIDYRPNWAISETGLIIPSLPHSSNTGIRPEQYLHGFGLTSGINPNGRPSRFLVSAPSLRFPDPNIALRFLQNILSMLGLRTDQYINVGGAFNRLIMPPNLESDEIIFPINHLPQTAGAISF